MRKELLLSGLALLILGCPASEDGISPTDVGVTSVMDGGASDDSDATTTSIDTAAGTVSIVLTMENGGLKPTWHNDTDQTIYLAGCTTVSFETVVNGDGTYAGVAAMCVWEGVAQPVLAHSTFSDMAFTPKTLGADYRAEGSYSLGCKPGLGITQAACTATISVTSNVVNAKGATLAQKYLFEIHYANFAWGRVHIDYYVTADGNVYRAEQLNDATAVIDSYSHDMTEDQITAHHPSGATLVTTVSPDILRAKLDLISFARQGELLSVSVCADYGTVDYIGFNYSPGTGDYDAILLAADGDSAIQNTAPEAQALADWLVGLQTPDAAPQRQCTYADGCALKSNCEVADCSVCAGLKMSCIVDKLNKTHCGLAGTCTTDLACVCLGDTVCAGGAQLCSGTAASGFGCAPK
jgi:hypothetical protein